MFMHLKINIVKILILYKVTCGSVGCPIMSDSLQLHGF